MGGRVTREAVIVRLLCSSQDRESSHRLLGFSFSCGVGWMDDKLLDGDDETSFRSFPGGTGEVEERATGNILCTPHYVLCSGKRRIKERMITSTSHGLGEC